MTENEAILIMDGATRDEHLYMYDAEDRPYLIARAENIALNALKEIQQYRAIGTVENIQLTFNLCKGLDCMVKMYEAIGTIEEFKALKEKSVAKKPVLNNPKINEFYVKEAKLCPVCHSYINDCSGDYCRDCGQRIDWSE